MADTLKSIVEGFPEIEAPLEEGDIVTDIVAILRVQKLSDTDDSIVLVTSDNTGGVTCHGVLTSAVLLHQNWMSQGKGDEPE